MLEAFAVFVEEAVHAGFGVPVVNDVQPAFVSEGHPRIVLEPLPLVVSEVSGWKPDTLEAKNGEIVVRERNSDVLQT